MDNSKTYLLEKIIHSHENGYDSFKDLNGKHVDDIAKLMDEFVKETFSEVIIGLNQGSIVELFPDFRTQLTSQIIKL